MQVHLTVKVQIVDAYDQLYKWCDATALHEMLEGGDADCLDSLSTIVQELTLICQRSSSFRILPHSVSGHVRSFPRL